MNLQPTLQNDLLKLRPLVADDFDALYAAANDPKIWDQHFDKRNELPNFKKFFSEGLDSKGALVAVHKNSNKIIGTSRYYQYEGFPDGIEIGWTFLARQYWGGMYNKMMKKMMIDHALKAVSTVYLMVDKNNFRSQKAVGKIGGRLLTEKEKENHPVTRPSNYIFIVSRDQWKAH